MHRVLDQPDCIDTSGETRRQPETPPCFEAERGAEYVAGANKKGRLKAAGDRSEMSIIRRDRPFLGLPRVGQDR